MSQISDIEGTGMQLEAIGKWKAEIPTQKPGEHLWIVAGMWRVSPEHFHGERIHLDLENMLSIDGPGCFWCEQNYSPELASKPCPGDPSA